MKKKVKTPLGEVIFDKNFKLRRGKVREIVDLGNNLLIVTTDRVSAFDFVLKSLIPFKGIVLNMLSLFWFEYFKGDVENHIITSDIDKYPDYFKSFEMLLNGRSVLVKKAEPILVECIVRGYISGSSWKEYKKSGSICGIKLPDGLRESEKLIEPIFTPSTKAEEGHDINITFSEMCNLIGEDLSKKIRDISIYLYEKAYDFAYKKGIILADTKMEFGIVDGKLVLIDEIFTPDCSRFWPLSDYSVGKSQPSLDKQYVRDYLLTIDWDRKSVPPPLPEDVIRKTSEKYLEIYKILTGKDILDEFDGEDERS